MHCLGFRHTVSVSSSRSTEIGAAAGLCGRLSLSKNPLRIFHQAEAFQNCKINFCSMILQFCRCGGLFDAKGNPDGFLSHYPSLRNFRLSSFFDSLRRRRARPCAITFLPVLLLLQLLHGIKSLPVSLLIALFIRFFKGFGLHLVNFKLRLFLFLFKLRLQACQFIPCLFNFLI